MRFSVVLATLALIAVPLLAQDKPENPKLRRQTNVISFEEIEAVRDQATDLMTVVQRLRPQFLRPRGAASFGNNRSGNTIPVAQVVVDGVHRGDVQMLRQLSTQSVKEIRYMSAADATTRFGTGFDAGAILVITR
jgi:hypothetical protein